jgi:Fe-S oxidoreductase/nitrate reductase gamma subunit
MLESLILAILIVAAAILFYLPVRQRLKIIKSTKGELKTDPVGPRVSRWIMEVVFQSKVISQRPFAGFMHALVFWGFAAFMLATTDHFCRGFGFSILGNGAFFHGYSIAVSVFAVLVMVGITALFIRRFIVKPEALGDHLSVGSLLVAIFIEGLMITYLLAVYGGLEVTTLSEASAGAKVNWWLHSLFILSFLVLIPRSKHLHLLFSLFTTFLKDFELAPLKQLDIENDEFGAENLKDLGPFTALGAFTCVECGRCFDHCPASQSGKDLNPKQLIMDLKVGYLKNADSAIVNDVIDPKVIWQCTTCGSCTFQCPVGIEHVTPIIDTRRGLAAEGDFPSPMTNLFKSLERHGNPWSYTPDQAHKFLKENNYPEYDGQEVLYWMGCFARYDERYRKVSLAFKEKLEEAGVRWGVLYDESCTGDSARRAGNEFLFMEIAMQNIELLNGIKARTIVSTCPHCVRTLKEYRSMEEPLKADFRFVHHATFLKELAAAGKIKQAEGAGEKVTYHDACYLSRYVSGAGVNDPRDFIRSRGCSISEPERKGVQSLCCGAGGAQFFNEEDEGERIYRIRTDELLKTGAKTIVTACPFCQAMIRDGLADKGVEDVTIKDLTQL